MYVAFRCPCAGFPLRGCTNPERFSRVCRAETSSRSCCVSGVDQVRELTPRPSGGCSRWKYKKRDRQFSALLPPSVLKVDCILVGAQVVECGVVTVRSYASHQRRGKAKHHCRRVERRAHLEAFDSVKPLSIRLFPIDYATRIIISAWIFLLCSLCSWHPATHNPTPFPTSFCPMKTRAGVYG